MSVNSRPEAVQTDARLAESIAQETNTPIEVVKTIYDEEFDAIVKYAKRKR